jgi:hypothetical protein
MSWGAQNRSKDAKTPTAGRGMSDKPELDRCPVQPYYKSGRNVIASTDELTNSAVRSQLWKPSPKVLATLVLSMSAAVCARHSSGNDELVPCAQKPLAVQSAPTQ